MSTGGIALALFVSLSPLPRDDGWTGQWVFPKENGIVLRNAEGRELVKWNRVAQVYEVDGDWLVIGHNQYPGPSRGRVRKSDVVKLADAVAYFTARIEADPSDAWPYMERGMAFSIKNEHDKAITDLTAGVKRAPTPANHVIRAIAWGFKKVEREAMNDLNEALRIDPKNVEAHVNRGIGWVLSEQPEKAMADFDEAIRLDPSCGRAFRYRGALLARKPDLEGSLKDFTEAIRLDPDDSEAYENRGWVRLEQGKYEESIADFNRSLKRDARNDKAFSGRAQSLMFQEKYDAAIRDLDQAIRFNAKDAATFCAKASCLAAIGKKDAALEALANGLSLGYPHLRLLEEDPLLEPVRADPRFQKLIDRYRGD
jgi:tetratricopeptide (TPR) repeat protein